MKRKCEKIQEILAEEQARFYRDLRDGHSEDVVGSSSVFSCK
jgi:hypothetical protein